MVIYELLLKPASTCASIFKGISPVLAKLVFEIGRPQAKATSSLANAKLARNSRHTRRWHPKFSNSDHRALNISPRQALNNCASAD